MNLERNPMALTPTSRLEAINELLDAIGESPVNAESNTGLVEADLAATRVDKTSRQVQKRGWHWNILKDYVIDPDVDGYIQLPNSTLAVDTSSSSRYRDLVQRGGHLYDRDNNTFVINKAIKVDITLYLDFEDLPENARDFIVMKAARKFQQRLFGSTELSEFDKDDERQSWYDLLDAESDAADYNMLRDNITVFRILNRKHFNKD